MFVAFFGVYLEPVLDQPTHESYKTKASVVRSLSPKMDLGSGYRAVPQSMTM